MTVQAPIRDAAAPGFFSATLAQSDPGLADIVEAFRRAHPTLFPTVAQAAGGQGVRPAAGLAEQAASALADGDVAASIALKNQQLRAAAPR